MSTRSGLIPILVDPIARRGHCHLNLLPGARADGDLPFAGGPGARSGRTDDDVFVRVGLDVADGDGASKRGYHSRSGRASPSLTRRDRTVAPFMAEIHDVTSQYIQPARM